MTLTPLEEKFLAVANRIMRQPRKLCHCPPLMDGSVHHIGFCPIDRLVRAICDAEAKREESSPLAKSLSELVDKMSPESRERAKQKFEVLLYEIKREEPGAEKDTGEHDHIAASGLPPPAKGSKN